ncbi:E3 ubiquitin-protein ligase ARIH2-like [Paramacrobiotus metropolitanus]|uniref:E3 ubiquitin-protein ligase ARIH2-like n=1 Tax=Paramacrobiotus metropolitanus TaxID=2943436 RepID=UPI0024463A5B|nr:E3 ubiquitin-protein ligase ARIH2-like [Paramacrobiotus metropolitanus]
MAESQDDEEDYYYDGFEEDSLDSSCNDVERVATDNATSLVISASQSASGDGAADPEFFEYVCLTEKELQEVLERCVQRLCDRLAVTRGSAKYLLIASSWNDDLAVSNYNASLSTNNSSDLPRRERKTSLSSSDPAVCCVCLMRSGALELEPFLCGHTFCADCWNAYFEAQVAEGKGYNILCMETDCAAVITEDFVHGHLRSAATRLKYRKQYTRDCIDSHPQMRHCPSYGCSSVFFAAAPDSKRVVCPHCRATFCFACGSEYHLPCDCRTIRQWWKKAMEDSETMSYMSSFTKDCPQCDSSIEKSGGCNHMICRMCAYEFCWVCLGAWKEHGNAYYECNKFSAKKIQTAVAAGSSSPAVAGMKNEAVGRASSGRMALNKYLFYFTRYKNHEQSLHLEENLMGKIDQRVEKKVQNREGSLIDWQCLIEAGRLLLKCRRTLQYTYAFAYYLQDGPDRMLFEHLQADLESTIENLSFSVERVDKLDLAALQAQMRSAEFRRRALFRDAAKLTVSPTPN